MEFKEGKCPNCGAKIKVDPAKDAAICEYCDSPFVVEKAIKSLQIGDNYIYNEAKNSNKYSAKEAREKTKKAAKEIKARKSDSYWEYKKKQLEYENSPEARKERWIAIGLLFAMMIMFFLLALFASHC